MRIGVLFRTEMIKVRRRPAFWVAVLALLAALALTYGIRLHASVKHGRTPAPLPEAWEGILLGTGPLPALLAAFAARSSGPAIGIFLLYLAIAEDVLLLVMRRIESIAAAADFLPGRLMVTLLRGEQYYAEAARRVIEAAQEAGRTPPTIHDTGTLLLAASSYALLFLAAAFVLYSRRDL